MKKVGKKANTEGRKMVKALKKQWKKEQPQREKLMKAGKKTLEHGIKIGGDVANTIKKDIKEIQDNK